MKHVLLVPPELWADYQTWGRYPWVFEAGSRAAIHESTRPEIGCKERTLEAKAQLDGLFARVLESATKETGIRRARVPHLPVFAVLVAQGSTQLAVSCRSTAQAAGWLPGDRELIGPQDPQFVEFSCCPLRRHRTFHRRQAVQETGRALICPVRRAPDSVHHARDASSYDGCL